MKETPQVINIKGGSDCLGSGEVNIAWSVTQAKTAKRLDWGVRKSCVLEIIIIVCA